MQIIVPILLILLNLSHLVHAATNSSSHDPWLTRFNNPRFIGCRRRLWICRDEDFPRIRRRCCRNRCVDVSSDVNNCGLCGIRCRFTRQCCRGRCVNTNRNPFHCGRCFHRCPFPRLCFYGMCGYAQPPTPRPCPPRPRPPKPPHCHGRRCPPLPMVVA
ncbi:hypothetical protein ACS0TY_022873 [Phlomoides rotata]